jgi:hypothetical protein
MDENYYKTDISDIANRTKRSVNEKSEAFVMDLVDSDIEGIMPRNMIGVSKEAAHRLNCKLTVPTNVGIEIPSKVTAGSAKELEDLLVNAVYSDGTTAKKENRLGYF